MACFIQFSGLVSLLCQRIGFGSGKSVSEESIHWLPSEYWKSVKEAVLSGFAEVGIISDIVDHVFYFSIIFFLLAQNPRIIESFRV